MDERKYNKLLSVTLENNEILKRIEAKLDSYTTKELLRPKEVQEILNISPSTYRRRLKDGIFTQIKKGNKVYVQRSEIDKLKSEGKV